MMNSLDILFEHNLEGYVPDEAKELLESVEEDAFNDGYDEGYADGAAQHSSPIIQSKSEDFILDGNSIKSYQPHYTTIGSTTGNLTYYTNP